MIQLNQEFETYAPDTTSPAEEVETSERKQKSREID